MTTLTVLQIMLLESNQTLKDINTKQQHCNNTVHFASKELDTISAKFELQSIHIHD